MMESKDVYGLKVLSDKRVGAEVIRCPDLDRGCGKGRCDLLTPCTNGEYKTCPNYSGGQR